MADETVADSTSEGRKTPRIGSPISRAHEMSMEAQALLDRHAREATELRLKLVAETSLLSRRAA